VLKKIFGPKTQVVAEEWRKVHIEELSDFYSSQNAIREIK
jgi:predicted DNA-binding protein